MPDAREQLTFDFARHLNQGPAPMGAPATGRQPQGSSPQPAHRCPAAPPAGDARACSASNTPGALTAFPLKTIRGRVLDGALTAQCRALASGLGLDELAAQVRVFWNSRLSTTAGYAHHHNATIELNPRLREFQPDEPDRTVRHELAHLVAQHRAGARRIRAHGRQWQQACAELGIPGESRCHDLPLERRRVRRKFAYQCRHCSVVVPRVRKLARHSACWACCKKFNAGRYSSQFLLLQIPLDEAKLLAPDAPW